MKQLTCEICGSTEIAKLDGFFVCQACGIKYSTEEVKKLLLDRPANVQRAHKTSKNDNSDFITKNLSIARRAKQKEDWAEAEQYYSIVEQNDPSNIEAIFYSSYSKAMMTLVDSDIYRREAAFNVLQNSISVIDEHYDYKQHKDIGMLEQISDDIFNMVCSSYVYKETKNGFGSVTSTEKYQTVTLFNNIGLAFSDMLDLIVEEFNDNEKDHKITLLNLALDHVEFILKNGSLQNPTQIRDYVAYYHEELHSLDPSHPLITAEDLRLAALPKSAKSVGWGIFITIGMILFSIFPLTGTLISGLALHEVNNGSRKNVNTLVAKITLIINIIITVLLGVYIALYLI